MRMEKYLFSTFDVSRQVFFKSTLSIGIVNLKPLLPGHVLVVPKRVVPRLGDLTGAEVHDLFSSVQLVGGTIERAYGGSALTISVQDGADAGQSVPHVHVHILPRSRTDFDGVNDRVYPALEDNEAGLKGDLADIQGVAEQAQTMSGAGAAPPTPVSARFVTPKEEDRRPRSLQEMEDEATWLAGLFVSPEQ